MCAAGRRLISVALAGSENQASFLREARPAALTDSLHRAFPPIHLHAERRRRMPWPPATTGLPGK